MNKAAIFLLFFASIALAGLFSCSDSSTNSLALPVITSIEPAAANPGDVITIYGANLGYNPANAVVRIGSLDIPFAETIKWNNSFIRLQLPLNAKSGPLAIFIDTVGSNSISLAINDVPAIDFVDIPAGDFMMGSRRGFGNEQPVHSVKLSYDFTLSKYEITQKIWQLVMKFNPSPVKSDNLPVMNITWQDAIGFCNKLSAMYGYDSVYSRAGNAYVFNSNLNGFRLPTEAEWEYACRAGSDSDFPGTGLLDDMGWYNGNSAFNPHTVGTKLPNQGGLFDMNGNVWEWCWDWYRDDYYSYAPAVDPTGPASGERHVLRGGSCGDGASFARSANRTYLSDDFLNCGLRIARDKY